MSVRAKFRCTYVQAHGIGLPYGGETVYLTAVYEDTGVNKQWSEATPSGDLRMAITNKDAFGSFEQGKEYYLEFTEAEA